jgi:hypothetical protein
LQKQAKDHLGIDGDEGSTLVEEIVSPFQATTMQRQPSNKATPLVTDSVAKPAVIQAGPEGEPPIQFAKNCNFIISIKFLVASYSPEFPLLHTGINQIRTGHLQNQQYTTTRGQLDVAHSPQPSVRILSTLTLTQN